MSIVEFHHGVSDKLAYACRLLRKAYRAGAQVVGHCANDTYKILYVRGSDDQ